MRSAQRPTCLVCQQKTSKYACASCSADYCSVACYKQHQEKCTSVPAIEPVPEIANADILPLAYSRLQETTSDHHLELQDPISLRPLTALKWPYVPDVSAYPDPLTRDDPKPLQMHQYEAIATSPAIRTLLLSNPQLRNLLASIDVLRGSEREEALQHALGVDSRLLKNHDASMPLDEDTRVFRELAAAVELTVRGGREDILGLDWDRVDSKRTS